MRKNCSTDREKLLKFEAEVQEFPKILRSLEQFIQAEKGQKKIWQQSAFLTCSWRFLMSHKLENYSSNWKNLLGFRNIQEKLENGFVTGIAYVAKKGYLYQDPYVGFKFASFVSWINKPSSPENYEIFIHQYFYVGLG